MNSVSRQFYNCHPIQTNTQIGRRFFLAPVALGDKDTVRNHSLPCSGSLKSLNFIPLILTPRLNPFSMPLNGITLLAAEYTHPNITAGHPRFSCYVPLTPSVPSGCHVLLQRRGSRYVKLVQAGQFRKVKFCYIFVFGCRSAAALV